MSKSVKPIPDGYHTATPYLVVRGGAKAIDFYRRAFGAEELFRMPGPDGSVMHAEIKIGDSIIMLSDENPQFCSTSPLTLNGTASSVLLYVTDCDATIRQAVAAGAKEIMPAQDMFWGDRHGRVQDPFGHQWAVSTHKEDVSPDEMARRMAAMGGNCE